MNFAFSPEQEQFRRDVREFLDATLTPEFWKRHREEREPGWSPEFSRAAAERGWLAVAWPEAYGGRGLGVTEQAIYMEEMAFADAPQEHHRRAVQQVGPTIMIFGTDEQKREYLPKIARGEISFAMGLSEPDAGSDLAAVSTRAVRDGDDWMVTGEKRFTSGAHYSDLLWTVVRTDPSAPKHRGISMLVLPLDAPGVQVQPLIDMQGRHHFNRIFMEDVRVPVDRVIGDENRGWYVNATTMDFERAGIARIARLRRAAQRAQDSVRRRERDAVGQALRARVAGFAVAVEVARLLAYRVVSLQAAGTVPNYEVSIVKLLASETSQAIHQAGTGIAGLYGQIAGPIDDGQWGETSWGPACIATIPDTIAQGSSEVQRTVIATRGLGLPRG